MQTKLESSSANFFGEQSILMKNIGWEEHQEKIMPT